MIIYEEMTDITTGGLVVPGGWNALILEVQSVRESTSACKTCGQSTGRDPAEVLYFEAIRSAGYSVEEARAWCREIPQGRFDFGQKHGLRSHIAHYVREYARRYPDLVDKQSNGSYIARGFDPYMMQQFYLPDLGRGIRAEGIDAALAEMAAKA